MSFEDEQSIGINELGADKAKTSAANLPGGDQAAARDLPLAMQRDEDVSEQNPDDLILANPRWGSLAMLAMAASFDTAVPAAVLAANYSLFRNADLRGEGSTNDGTMTLEAHFREKFEGVDENGKPKNAEDDESVLERYMELADERAERKREMDEWQHETHSFAGQNWTGEQWAEVADDLQEGGAGRDWLISYLMNKEHQTKEEAEKTAGEMDLAANGMSKPEWARTTAEREAMQSTKDNPAVARAYDNLEKARMEGFKPVAPETRAVTSTTQAVSVDARSEGLYDDFPSAPNLVEHHQAAVAATEPLDAKAADQIASATPQPKPGVGAGLDV